MCYFGIGIIPLTILYLSLYGLLATQLRVIFIDPTWVSIFICLSVASWGLWLATLPFRLIMQRKNYQLIVGLSLFFSLLLLILSGTAMILIQAIIHTIASYKPVFEKLYFWNASICSLLSAGITTAGIKLIHKYAHLDEQSRHYQTLAEQHALVREVFEIIHHTQNEEDIFHTVLTASLQLTKAKSACIIPYHAETKQFGTPLANLPKDLESVSIFPSSFEKNERHGIAFPIQLQDQPAAFLMIHQPEHIPHFSPIRTMLNALCKQTAIALNRIQLQNDKSEVEERFNKQLHLTKTLAENLGLGIFATRETGELAFINPTAENLLGWNQQADLRNQPFLPLIQTVSLPGDTHSESHFICKDGGELPVFCASAPIDIDSRQQGTLYVFQDLRLQKKTEGELKQYVQKLKQSNQELRQFAYLASHDLQAPLIKLQNFSNMLKNSTLDTEGQDIAHRIQNSAQHMQEMIQSILTLAHISTGPKSFETVDLNELLQQVLQEQEDKINRLNAQIHIGPMTIIEGSPKLLRILLHNLVDNALKFHHADTPPKISIECESPQPNLCRLRIHDNGIGFHEHQTQRIFNMFERLHGFSEYKGNGIGLSLCKKIAEQHSGDITAHSTLNHGSTFTITLPIKHA